MQIKNKDEYDEHKQGNYYRRDKMYNMYDIVKWIPRILVLKLRVSDAFIPKQLSIFKRSTWSVKSKFGELVSFWLLTCLFIRCVSLEGPLPE